MVRLRHWIGGAWVSGGGGRTVSLDPSRPEETLAEVAVGTDAEVGRAVAAASDAFLSWRRATAATRAEALFAWAEGVRARSEDLASAIVREVGKPVGEARGEVARCVAILRYFAGEAVRPSGDVIPAHVPGGLQYSLREPLGVVGLVTSWNFPLAIPIWKAAPALALGNTVVLKPAEEAILCASFLAETCPHLPAGTFNVVFGEGETGAALVRHPGVRGVSFTGSAAVGRAVAVACAGRGSVKYQTEMGGKNPAIVHGDADLALAAHHVAGGAMRFAGQKCTATGRTIVHRSIADEFSAALVAAVEALPVGPPEDATTAVGPVVSAEAVDRLRQAVERAGGRVLYRSPSLPPGFGFPPTVLADVPRDAPILREELFGPVLTVEVADDIDHAISLANDVPFGLSASLFTRDLRLAHDHAARIEAGMVRVNADTTGVDPHAPFGGVKGSSSGTREQGPAAKDFYTELKTVQVNP